MAKPRDLRVNTLDRYVKTSDRLVLESYSSCEVPLGCGGSLVRWVDPEQSLPLTIHSDFGDRRASIYIDGEHKRQPRVMVSPGKHVLALVFESSPLPLSIRLMLGYDPESSPARTRAPMPKTTLATAADQSWFGTATEPAEPWMTALDEVSGFVALRAMPPPPRQRPYWNEKRFERCATIGLSTREGAAWVRRVFSVRFEADAWVIE